MLVHLNIGSNQGNRRLLIGKAIALIADRLKPISLCRSEWFESSPWGFESEHSFVNIGVDIEIPFMDPENLLDELQKVERELSQMPHRNADGSYRDREIDIDIILIDDLQINTHRLTVPHPRMMQRDFVLKPLAQLRERGSG